jgi:hypothetical protein
LYGSPQRDTGICNIRVLQGESFVSVLPMTNANNEHCHFFVEHGIDDR